MANYARVGLEKDISQCLPTCEKSILKTAKVVLQILNLWSKRKVERDQLKNLDERLLKDMGITRYDVDQEASKPFWRD